MKVDTFGGTVHVEWDPDAAATPLGHLAFCAEYLKVSGRFDALVADCPLHYRSPNAPSKRDILGTTMLSILAGQWRYAHITALRGDGVNPALLGMTKVAREDAVRRALERIPADDGASWHWHRRAVAVQALRRQHVGRDQVMQQLQRPGTRAHLVGQCRQAQIDALSRVAVPLPVQRQVLPVLLEEDRRHPPNRAVSRGSTPVAEISARSPGT